MKKLTESSAWKALLRHQQDMSSLQMSDLFDKEPARGATYSIQAAGLLLDYSRNLVSHETLPLFKQLADQSNLFNKINSLFDGDPINGSEKRPALHTSLRHPHLSADIQATRQQLNLFVEALHQGKLSGATGAAFTHIVNIGIGGSYLGPLMSSEALKEAAISPLRFHFISTVDPAHVNDVWDQLNPETTLFIISSKSFGTIETLTNARTLIKRMKALFGEQVIAKQFVAITAKPEKAIAFGISPEFIFPMWDWVGGRYSIWSAIGLPLLLMIGSKQFDEFLLGAHAMDEHFRHADATVNMPVILAMLSIWYTNFFDARAQAIIPYAYRLRYLIPYLQQVSMESNGKSVTNNGNSISYQTCPVIFGEEGCNGQHTYHQLLHQGSHLIPADFILVSSTTHQEDDEHQSVLLASGLSQAQALLVGKSADSAKQALREQGIAEAEADFLSKHQAIPGNRPSNILFIDRLTPHTLGALIALYEHKIFVQSVIWDINPFDQWGVELGKQLLPDILQTIQQGQGNEWLKRIPETIDE